MVSDSRQQHAAQGWLARLGDPLRTFGFGPGLLYMVDRCLQRLSPRCRLHVYEFVAQPIGMPKLPAHLSKNIEYRLIAPDDPAIDAMPARADVKRARFEQGAQCLGTYRKGRLIGYVWLAFGAYLEDEVRCRYVLERSEESVFDFDLVVLPEHRMGIGFVALWDSAARYLGERGVRWTFSRLTRFNVGSRRAHAHLGARRVGQAAVLQLGRREVMLSTLPPFVSLSLDPARRATIRLRPPSARAAPDT